MYVAIKDLYMAMAVLALILVKNTFFSASDGYQFMGVSFALFQICYYIKSDINCRDLVSKLSFFPQLYCGPIVKPSGFDRLKRINVKSLALYHLVFFIGLFFKIYVAYVTQKVFATDDSYLNSIFWLAYMYSDYLSWSLMGIGIAGLAGFKMPMSFKAPFFVVISPSFTAVGILQFLNGAMIFLKCLHIKNIGSIKRILMSELVCLFYLYGMA